MAEHNDLGKLGEELAVEFLEKNGYSILETNWTFQKAEVDIIAKKDGILAVVEVKTRSSIDFGLPQDFVKPNKQYRKPTQMEREALQCLHTALGDISLENTAENRNLYSLVPVQARL